MFKLKGWNESLNENFLLGVRGVTVVFLSGAGGICSGTCFSFEYFCFLCQYHSNNAVH